MKFGNVARVLAVAAACLAAAGSATSTNNSPGMAAQNAQTSPPPPRDMESSRALGLWRSDFGAVKIEADNSNGGLQAGAIQGIWTYQRQGQEVIGYFAGTLRGNVLQFRWNEPGTQSAPLQGEGFLVFDPQGRTFSGRWWTDKRERVGEWHGSRQGGTQSAGSEYPQQGGYPPYGNGQYGGSAYGGQPDGGYAQPPSPQQGQPQYPQQQPQYPQQQPQYPQQQPQPRQYPQQQPQQPQYPQQQPQQPNGYPQGYPNGYPQ